MNLFIIVFPVAPKMVQVWWGKGSGAGDQDRVGSPCANQEILGNICHMHLVAPLAPVQGWLSVTGGLAEWATSVLLNYLEGRLGT